MGSHRAMGKEQVWHQEANHDTCWRSDGLRKIWENWIQMARPISDSSGLTPNELHSNIFITTPKYVWLQKNKQVHPLADRCEEESREQRIALREEGLDFDEIHMRTYSYEKNGKTCITKSGLLIKGSDSDQKYTEIHSWKEISPVSVRGE